MKLELHQNYYGAVTEHGQIGDVAVEISTNNESADIERDELERARRTQTVRCAVAPRCRVLGLRGWINAGCEISAEHLAGDAGRLDEIVLSGWVIRLDDIELAANTAPEDAPYRIAPGRSLLSRLGVLPPGYPITPELVAEPPRPAQEARSFPSSHLAPAFHAPAMPATPGDDGRARLAHLISRGYVVERHPGHLADEIERTSKRKAG